MIEPLHDPASNILVKKSTNTFDTIDHFSVSFTFWDDLYTVPYLFYWYTFIKNNSNGVGCWGQILSHENFYQFQIFWKKSFESVYRIGKDWSKPQRKKRITVLSRYKVDNKLSENQNLYWFFILFLGDLERRFGNGVPLNSSHTQANFSHICEANTSTFVFIYYSGIKSLHNHSSQ